MSISSLNLWYLKWYQKEPHQSKYIKKHVVRVIGESHKRQSITRKICSPSEKKSCQYLDSDVRVTNGTEMLSSVNNFLFSSFFIYYRRVKFHKALMKQNRYFLNAQIRFFWGCKLHVVHTSAELQKYVSGITQHYSMETFLSLFS